MPSVHALEFYSGIGGLHFALLRSHVSAQVVRAFDWDQAACQVYAANHGPDVVQKIDISTLTGETLAVFDADLWLLSPSCQPYTFLNPLAKGDADPRSKSFLHLIEGLLPGLVASGKHPSRLLVENVAGFESSRTRSLLVSTLKSLGYETFECALSPLQFGIPNSRLRYYLLAKKAPLRFPCQERVSNGTLWRCIPGRLDSNQSVDSSEAHVAEVRAYLDCEGEATDQYSIPDRVLCKWGRLLDIVLPSSRRTCCFTRGYTKLVEGAGSVLQMNEDLDTSATFKQFLQAQESGDPHAVHILHPLRLRYLSPAELLRLFDFEPNGLAHRDFTPFVWPPAISTKTKYRLIGNSVNVKVVTELLKFLFEYDG